jgi:hypothetical protein
MRYLKGTKLMSKGVAAMLAVTITHPIDQTKIRAQTQAVKANMLTTMRNTIHAGGIRELWVGLSGSLLRQGTYGSVRFGVYGELNSRDAKRRRARGGTEAGALELVKNGAIAGVFAGVAGVPGGELPPSPLSTLPLKAGREKRLERKRYRRENADNQNWFSSD